MVAHSPQGRPPYLSMASLPGALAMRLIVVGPRRKGRGMCFWMRMLEPLLMDVDFA